MLCCMEDEPMLNVGELYRPDDLPENIRKKDGDVEWVSNTHAYLADKNIFQYKFEVFDRVMIESSRWKHDAEDRVYRCVEIA